MTSVPATAVACVYEGVGKDIKIDEKHPVTQPQDLKPGDVLVKLEYSGVCHSDLHLWKGDFPFPLPFPLIGGHEGAGHIAAIGEGTDTSLKIGQPVGIKWIESTCMDVGCGFCSGGMDQHCLKAKMSGCMVDGTFRQYMVSSAKYLTPIPEALPLEYAAPVLCAGVTSWGALKRSNTKPGDWVTISGAGGGLGHLAVQYASAIGLKVVAIDTGAEKRKLLESYGVDKFIDFRDYKDANEIVAAVKETCDGLGPHAAIVTATGPNVYDQALQFLRPCGTLVAVALASNTKIEAELFGFIGKGLKIVGSYVGSRHDALEALDFVARGKVKPQVVVKPMRKIQEVLGMLEKGQVDGRLVLKLQDE
ncbi:alcohol dehydrogenase [Rhodotorula toruloides]|uniref:alcohol dehydrogenase n=1 Tax=Rhodotorula toruloides TaxID=5286 RepID=A0A511KP20_RHOTO|nr:alcohol dehydrogenase [Rhodotorula toruloides]